MLALLAFTLLVAKACSNEDRIGQDEAVAIAEKQLTAFEPDDVQVRFLRQGIPSRGYWAVSFYTLDKAGNPLRVRLVLVDAETGVARDAAAGPPAV